MTASSGSSVIEPGSSVTTPFNIIPSTNRKSQQQSPPFVTPCDTNVTGQNGKPVTVTRDMYVEYFRKNPDRVIVLLDLQDHFHVSPASIRKALSRLSKPGKGGGPIKRVDQGLYQYDPSKEKSQLGSVLREGTWCFENVVFVKKGTQSIAQSQERVPLDQNNSMFCDMDKPVEPKPGGDWVKHSNRVSKKLPTGQDLGWWVCQTNRTEMICISAKGAPPISLDLLLTLMADLEDHGLEVKNWDLSCVEYVCDSEKIRYEGTFTYQFFKNELYKGYNHGYYGRFEIRDNHRIPLAEFINNCQILVTERVNNYTLRKVESQEKKIYDIGKEVRLARNVAQKALENQYDRKPEKRRVRRVTVSGN